MQSQHLQTREIRIGEINRVHIVQGCVKATYKIFTVYDLIYSVIDKVFKHGSYKFVYYFFSSLLSSAVGWETEREREREYNTRGQTFKVHDLREKSAYK